MGRLFLVAPLALAAFGQPRTHELKLSPKTVVWGYHDAATPAVLKVRSGDAVRIETAMIASPEMMTEAGLPAAQVRAVDREIHETVKDRGPGPHINTGPVYVEGAEPGDALEVRIEAVDFAVPYSLILFQPGMGLLPDDFPYSRVRIFPLDLQRRIARMPGGVEVPLKPFFGLMGLAPPKESGRISSAPPWIHAGNLDNKELVAGTTLFIPVHVRGGLFTTGDGHAAQGDGEVCLAALETALDGTFRFIVRKDMRLRWPRAETPTHLIAMGFHEDLDEAARLAVRDMIDWLTATRNMTRDDAYFLCSSAVDLRVTQVVDGRKGIHAMVPKSIFRR